MHPAHLRAFLLVLAIAAPVFSQAKRPLNHADYAAWRSIQSPALSPDGALVAYALSPQEGDGEFVLLDLRTGKETRSPRGSRPTVAVAAPRKGAPAIGASQHLFSPDGKYVLFPAYHARGEKGKSLLTGSALCVMETATGKVTRLEAVQGYQVAEEGPAFAAYLRGVKKLPPDPSKGEKTTPKSKGKAGTLPAAPPGLRGELVLRDLATGDERSFDEVTEFSLARDGKSLVYAVNPARKDAAGGVFAVVPGQTLPPAILRSGLGKFSRITWDEKQTQAVFFHSPPAPPDAKTPAGPPQVVHWKRSAPATLPAALIAKSPLAASLPVGTELTAAGKPSIQDGWRISEGGGLAFSLDGSRVYFGLVPPTKPRPPADRVSVDLWHYQDDFIQPMQKARYGAAQAKTYRGVFDLASRTSRQLADESLPEVSPPPAGDTAVGADDRPYRRLVGGSELTAFADLSFIDLKTGVRKALLKKQSGLAWSPAGKHLLRFDGQDWHCVAVATGKSVNLTAKLEKVPFADETFDMPSTRPAFGVAGWLPGDEAVLIYDRYDIWRFAPDGSAAKNVTAGIGKKNAMALRFVQLDPRARTIDPSKPLLLRAENEETRDTGFYRLRLGSEPKLLIMGARYYSPPLRAAKGGRYLLTVSTASDYPDLYSADEDFTEVKRITDANPGKKAFTWPKAEMVKYRSADGVPLQGVLLKPDDFHPDKKYPMIVYIYERLSQNMHRFIEPRPGTSINPTYYASNGYLVLMPDIAYTVGYPGASAQKCVLPAIDKVIDMGCVDEKAIGIQGHSWGGYQTAFLVTQTTRFKAAAAGAPVTNMTSAYGGIRWGTGLPRQFQYEKSQSRIGGTLWQYPTRFVENSPLFHADRVKTPLLMLHNDRDEAVPWQEGIQYYLALRRLEKEAYLFNYVGEGHGLTQRKNQLDYTVRMQQFFDHHLKGAKMPAWMAKGEPYAPPPEAQTPRVTGGAMEEEE